MVSSWGSNAEKMIIKDALKDLDRKLEYEDGVINLETITRIKIKVKAKKIPQAPLY